LLAAPLPILAVLLPLSRASASYMPAILVSDNRPGLLLIGLGTGLLGGLFEELGWTGVAVRAMRRGAGGTALPGSRRHGILGTGLMTGYLWALWHGLITVWASGDAAGTLSLPLLLPPLLFYVLVLPVFRVLMVWLYDRTDSLLLAVVMHASLTASSLFILMPAATGDALSLYYVALAGTLWLVVGLIALVNGGRLERDCTR
jgi:membrane protease YdiL (CAAX protease family)